MSPVPRARREVPCATRLSRAACRRALTTCPDHEPRQSLRTITPVERLEIDHDPSLRLAGGAWLPDPNSWIRLWSTSEALALWRTARSLRHTDESAESCCLPARPDSRSPVAQNRLLRDSASRCNDSGLKLSEECERRRIGRLNRVPARVRGFKSHLSAAKFLGGL